MPANWITVSESSFPWERDALDFIRSRFPNHELVPNSWTINGEI